MKFTLTGSEVLIAFLSIIWIPSFVFSDDRGDKCADCRHYNAVEKKPKSSGFWCQNKQDRSKIISQRPNKTDPYKECSPHAYTISAEIADFCCLWGPDLGCGQVVGQRQQENWKKIFPITCQYCINYCFPKPKVQYCSKCESFNDEYYDEWTRPKSTGFKCANPEDTKKIQLQKKGQRTFTFKNTCVPSPIIIDGFISHNCCFWSKSMGCGRLVGDPKQDSCDDCKGICPYSANGNIQLSFLLLAISIVDYVLV